jgi:hypothetical protein
VKPDFNSLAAEKTSAKQLAKTKDGTSTQTTKLFTHRHNDAVKFNARVTRLKRYPKKTDNHSGLKIRFRWFHPKKVVLNAIATVSTDAPGSDSTTKTTATHSTTESSFHVRLGLTGKEKAAPKRNERKPVNASNPMETKELLASIVKVKAQDKSAVAEKN